MSKDVRIRDYFSKPQGIREKKVWLKVCFFLHGEGPRSRCYGRNTALRLFVQPYDEDEQFFLPSFPSDGAPVE
jgi:hypothetical protein